MQSGQTPYYHVTTLSNFAKGYDRYTRRYAKTHIPESTFPDRFFLLKKHELSIGIAKAQKLLERLNLPGDRLIVLETAVANDQLRADHASGLGQYMPQNFIDLAAVHYFEDGAAPEHSPLVPVRVEDVTAQSFEVTAQTLLNWDQLKPRTISILPIAEACQASCRFCFSKASVSADFSGRIKDWGRIDSVLADAKQAGAERAVITGGGEPTLLKHDHLVRLIATCAQHFNKVVLITNGHVLAAAAPDERQRRLRDLGTAGLSVLAISRHHHDADRNADIMRMDTKTESLAAAWNADRAAFPHMAIRLTCVLQDEGIATVKDVENYVSWTAAQGIRDINFKELYVSTTNESVYSGRLANAFSAQHQVPLSVVHDFICKHGWQKTGELPWGAPIFEGGWNGQHIRIAAYTEPSVYWERTHGVARSWNLMSDGTVLASLEDPRSIVAPR